MKRISLIAVLTAVMVMISAMAASAAGDLELVSSYPENEQTDTSMENLGVKLTFNNPINSEQAKKIDEGKFSLKDADGETVPVKVLFSEKDDGLVLVLADIDQGFTAKNNMEYILTIDAGLTDNAGNVMDQPRTISFFTYNQKANTIINMVMMFVMMGGIMFISMRQNLKTETEETVDEATNAAFNPYKEAKKSGKSIEEVKAAQARKEAKEAKKKSRKAKAEEDKQEKKIEKCADYLNNVYHVHAPAPTSKEDRSIEAIRAAQKKSRPAKKK